MNHFVKTSIYFGLLVGALVSSVKYFIFSGFTIYLNDEAYSISESMPEDERMAYFRRSVQDTGWLESVLHGASYKGFWIGLFHDFLVVALFAWLTCAVLGLLLRLQKRRQ